MVSNMLGLFVILFKIIRYMVHQERSVVYLVFEKNLNQFCEKNGHYPHHFLSEMGIILIIVRHFNL